MYFLKFIKWFWIDYLDDIGLRIIAGFIVWISTVGIVGVISALLNAKIIFEIFFMISLGIVGIFALGALFVFIRNRYREWQDQVFDTLRKEPKGYTDE